MTRWLARGQAFGLAMLLAGCGDADPLGPSETYEGFFQMDRVDDRRIPFLVSSDGECQTFYMGGAIRLDRSGDFQMEFDRTTEVCNGLMDGGPWRGASGTYRINGEQILFELDHSDQVWSGVYRSHKRIDETTTRMGTIEIEIDSRQFLFVDVKSTMW